MVSLNTIQTHHSPISNKNTEFSANFSKHLSLHNTNKFSSEHTTGLIWCFTSFISIYDTYTNPQSSTTTHYICCGSSSRSTKNSSPEKVKVQKWRERNEWKRWWVVESSLPSLMWLLRCLKIECDSAGKKLQLLYSQARHRVLPTETHLWNQRVSTSFPISGFSS